MSDCVYPVLVGVYPVLDCVYPVLVGADAAMKIRSASPDVTREIAVILAQVAQPGDLIILAGDMGAGKTCFAGGFARGLGISDRITSPTFTLVNTYDGRLRLHHLDVYRLDQLHEALDLGLAELLDDGSVTLIEWGDVISPVLPSDYLEIQLDCDDDDDEKRTMMLVQVGASWASRMPGLTVALEQWSC